MHVPGSKTEPAVNNPVALGIYSTYGDGATWVFFFVDVVVFRFLSLAPLDQHSRPLEQLCLEVTRGISPDVVVLSYQER